MPGAGLAVRMPCTYLVMYGSGFSAREKLFFALAWSPKACSEAVYKPLLGHCVLLRIRCKLPMFRKNHDNPCNGDTAHLITAACGLGLPAS